MSGRGKHKAGMIVRVGLAASFHNLTWDERRAVWCTSCKRDRDLIMAVGRAVLEEMLKPTSGMVKAAGAAMSPGKRPTDKLIGVRAKHAIRYQAMIEAALAEKPTAAMQWTANDTRRAQDDVGKLLIKHLEAVS